MTATKFYYQHFGTLTTMGTRRSRNLIFLMGIVTNILLFTFAVPTVKAAEVPNVFGLTQTAAEAAIVAVGLTVGSVTTANSNTHPIGTVIGQDPGAGVNVVPGGAVDLVVVGVVVPAVEGLTQAAAQAAITNASLLLGTVTSANSSTVPIGKVISQSPSAGSNVVPNSSVALVISLGASVPNVVGLSQSAAQTAINNAGLILGTVTKTNMLIIKLRRCHWLRSMRQK